MSTKSSGLIGLIKKQDIAVKAVVLCALFAGILCVLVLRAPARIRGAELDKAALVSKENQKVILHLSQQVDSVKDYQVTVSPSADYSVLSTGTSIVVEFKQRLDYATKYSISLSQLKTTYGAKKLASVKYSFSTPNPVMYYLKRNYPTNKLDAEGKSKPDDEIIVYNVTSRSKETVAHLPRINQFILAGSKLVISALNDDDTTRLVELDVHTKRQKDIDLPSAGTVSNLTYSGDGSTYGFSFTSNEKKYNEKKYVNSVFTRDISSGLTIPVKGLDKSILRSSRWQFVPNSTSILAQTTDSNYIVFDINEAVLPVPIGRYQEAYNFTPDGQQVAFLDRFEGIKIYNMSTGEVKDLMSTYSSASGQYVVDFWLLKKGYIEEVSFVDDTEVNVENSVIVSSKNNSREIYSSNTRDIYVYGVSTSPNEQNVVLNVSNKEGEKYDSYTNSLSEQARLLILDRQSGKQLNDIEGSFPQWSNDAR